MLMETMKILFSFEANEDLAKKTEQMVTKIEELETLAKKLQSVINEEVDKNKGLFIEEMGNSIDEHIRYSQLYYDAVKTSVGNSNDAYNKRINEIKAHNITVHYQVIEMNQTS